VTTKTEYVVLDVDGSTGGFTTREEARNFKRMLTEVGVKSQIIQNVWTLNKQKVIR
jgi:hypothetical protein